MSDFLEKTLEKTLVDLYTKIENTPLEPFIGPYIKSYLPPVALDPISTTPIAIKSLYHPFKLPLKYLDDKSLHPLSPVVSSDLELVLSSTSATSTCIYDALFQPKHAFAKNMIQEWNTHYSTNIPFLNDTQSVLRDIGKYKNTLSTDYSVDCTKMLAIWADTKEDKHFLEKYSYMDWEILDHLNHSASFLQILSIANITSPLMSLLVPVLFLIFPFLILKIQKIPISFDVYIDTLKNIAKNHFIGKTLLNMQSLSWDKVIYMCLTFGLYIMQIYQNINSCFRFYRNLTKINSQLCEMRDYLLYSIYSMETFVQLNLDKPTYKSFITDIENHIASLKLLLDELQPIKPFKPHPGKLFEIGYMLKCYYELHSNQEYSDSIQFSFGFEGYINNMLGVYANIEANKVSYATFDQEKDTEFKSQVYPQLHDGEYIVNDCSFQKNMIISGANASGKTTILKTTSINIIFSQQIGCGFYSACSLNPYTHIHSYLNIPDTSGRDSLFQAESRRCKEILDIIKATDISSRHFCIFDELFSGTNYVEAVKSAYAFLLYLSGIKNVNFMLTTHYISVCKKMKKSKNICNYKMGVSQDGDKLKYTYKMKKGISKIQGAVCILRDMDYPAEILDSIKNYK